MSDGAAGTQPPRTLAVGCCIAGGGPAGMMAGLLLARAGVEVTVLEKHGDFLRDFRGDTIHPSTLELMAELGWLEEFLALPHQRAETLAAVVGGERIPFADFRHLPTRCGFVALMPQWDFLDFLARKAARYPGFRLLLSTEATGLLEEGGTVRGVHASAPDGALEVVADLTIAADGRHSRLREAAGLKVEVLGAPMDVLWFRLSRRPDDPEESTGHFGAGRILALLQRGSYWQCGYVIPKGADEGLRRGGLPAFRRGVETLVPFLAGRMAEIADWDAVKLLSVQVDRLARWHRPGLLCIGDAAHAMSPIGGVGVNLAVQDAVAAANLLWRPLRNGRPTAAALARVEERRLLPTRLTQTMQVFMQRRVIATVLGSREAPAAPLPLRLFRRVELLRRFPARLVGLGVRPEHVESPEVA